LWMLADLYERLPEVGDLEKPKLVFFFDEAHLLFKDAPAALLEKIEQVVRLIRSKGVGVYFVTQNPADTPDTVLGQLGHRVQHALRAYTPRDRKAVKTAAQTMRPNPGLDIEAAITELAVGEALVSLLDPKGQPTPTQRVWMAAPGSRIGPATAAERQAIQAASMLAGKYDQALDRESAYEILLRRAQPGNAAPADGTGAEASAPQDKGIAGVLGDFLFGSTGPRGGRRDGVVQSVAKSMVRNAANQLVRGLLGSLVGGRRR
ncbi:MAG: helicase HerA-like domain-containing protein, partial [Castellaniella sp.]